MFKIIDKIIGRKPIMLTVYGMRKCFNVNEIANVRILSNGIAQILYRDGLTYRVDESYEEVLELIKNAKRG